MKPQDLQKFHQDAEHGQYDCIGYGEGQACCAEYLPISELVELWEAAKALDGLVIPTRYRKDVSRLAAAVSILEAKNG